jgi:UDP-2,3-diacylglucosamine hydrolase
MKMIFLSDAHLKGTGDAVHEKLIRFLDRLRGRNGTGQGTGSGAAITVDHLVIAGDFFDFWFGRGDAIFPGFVPVVERLAALRRSGVQISLCEGNHDFFLSDYFSRKLGMDVYPEWVEWEFDGRRILASHGDTVDRSNLKYLALRKLLRSGFFQLLHRILPLKFLWLAARISSKTSKSIPGKTDDRLSEIMYRFALGKFREGYDAVILGHCHRPILREEEYEGRRKTFATLGDWATHDTYLVYDEGRFFLERFPPALPDGGDVNKTS